MPILEGVLIESFGNLTMTCSDATFTISTTIDNFEEKESGSAVIPAKKLLEVVKKMSSDKPISIESDGGTALIKCGSTKVKLPVLDPEEFPRMAMMRTEMIEIEGDSFAKLVDGTKFAVSTNEHTPILQGILFKQQGSKINTVATDRHRLAMQVIPSKGQEEEHVSQHVAPVRALEAVAQLKPDIAQIAFADTSMFIKAGAYEYISRLLDGSYPDTTKLIPKEAKVTATANTKKLLQTLELAEKIVEEKTKVVRLDVSEDEIFVSATDSGTDMEESIEAETTGEIKISANAKYLIDALKCIPTEQTEIWFTGAMHPIIIKPKGDDSSLHLVLPYRTAGGES